MDFIHFMEWMDYFIHKIERGRIVPKSRRYLLVLNEHKSHINLDVLLKAKNHKIDMIFIPLYMSH